jgi:intein-encoded DNA endonuclease-like protein
MQVSWNLHFTMLYCLKVNVSRLKQFLNQNLKKVAFKYIRDFVKMCNLQISYFIFRNEICLNNTFTQLYSNILYIHFYDTIVFKSLSLHSYEVNTNM